MPAADARSINPSSIVRIVFLRGFISVLLFQKRSVNDWAPATDTPTPATRQWSSSRSLDQENTTTKKGWTAIWEERSNEETVKLFGCGLEKGQNSNGSACWIRRVAAVFRRGGGRVNYQRTLFHHSPWRRSVRRCCGRPLRIPGDL